MTSRDLRRTVTAEESETHLRQGLLPLDSRRVETNTVLCLDLCDMRNEHARKMEFLDQVMDVSAGELHASYWLCSVMEPKSTAANSAPPPAAFLRALPGFCQRERGIYFCRRSTKRANP